MIAIIQPKTTLDRNLEKINLPLVLVESHCRAIASKLNEAMGIFWSLPDEELLEVVNSKGPAEMQVIFAAHAESAGAINTMLESRGIPPLAAIGAQRELVVNPTTGLFEFAAPQ